MESMNNSMEQGIKPLEIRWEVTVILSIIVLLTVCGNILVIGAVMTSSNLRGPTHILIANLAVADLLLGTLVLPFSATQEVTEKWYFGAIFCDVWAAVDVLCCTASILSLCVISMDRYIGVTRPLSYYSIVTTKRSSLLCVAVWILSLAISIGPLLGWKERDVLADDDGSFLVCPVNTQPGYVLFSAIGSFYLPMFVILVLYWRIYRAAERQTKFLESGIKTAKSYRSEITLRVHVGRNRQRYIKDAPRSPLPQALPEHRATSNKNSRTNSSMEMTTFRSGSVSGSSQKEHLEEIPPDDLNEENTPSISCSVNAKGKREDDEELVVTGACIDVSDNNNPFPIETQPHPRRAAKSIALNAPLTKLFKFRRQKKAAKTLGIVVGAFLLCWFPFFVVHPVGSLHRDAVPKPLFACCFWLGYFNSCINPFIYASTSREFKRAFSRILCNRRFRQ